MYTHMNCFPASNRATTSKKKINSKFDDTTSDDDSYVSYKEK